jgi:Ser/Thr protein kinase RdoA (MazF antagonist)
MKTDTDSAANIPLGNPIARGRTADIYAWQDGNILKLFHDWFDLDSIEYEAEIARAVHASGLPVPRVGDILHVDGHNGLVYQRINGRSMLEALQRKPWMVFNFARRQAALHAQMHTRRIAVQLPSQKERLENKIRQAHVLPVPLQTALLSKLESLPQEDRLCHGDFHPGNILLNAGQAVVIDWIDSTLGNPLADVARSSIIALGAAATDQIPNPFMKIVIRLFNSIYLRSYFRLLPGGRQEFQHWLPVVAAARLSENMPELEHWLITFAQATL